MQGHALGSTGSSKKNPAKFGDTCSVRAEGLCIIYILKLSWPRSVGRKRAGKFKHAGIFSHDHVARDVGRGAEGPGKNALKSGRDDMIEEAGKHIPNTTSLGYS